MLRKAKSFTTVTAAAFVAVFFATAAPKASAQESDSFYGRFPMPEGSVCIRDNDGRDREGRFRDGRGYGRRYDDRSYDRRYDDRSYVRRYDERSWGRRFGDRDYGRRFFRPYRDARVFIYDPFPHWVVRRVCDDPSVAYDPDCDRY